MLDAQLLAHCFSEMVSYAQIRFSSERGFKKNRVSRKQIVVNPLAAKERKSGAQVTVAKAIYLIGLSQYAGAISQEYGPPYDHMIP